MGIKMYKLEENIEDKLLFCENWGSNCFVFPKITEQENVLRSVRKLAASIYYT